ncbi:aspartate ammonia-lyase [Candidatus Sumerlaeota bacterium]|nr:aspartate ammonia-lyase [Candidatus Sumerlaeota bacterium]
MTIRHYRREKDLLGEREVPADALWGIHTLRAVENFPIAGRPVRAPLIRAYGAVKLACAQTNRGLGRWDEDKAAAIQTACSEMMAGQLDAHIVVDALQGGAGTSTNMNVNEVLANRALQLLGRRPGDYAAVHPIDDINLHQSTNDTYPTALKVAAIWEVRRLEREVVGLLEEFQRQEKAFAHVVKVGRTQMQDAVLTTLGREMGAYAEAFGRDRWRIYKCEERLRTVNLGGTAIGTGLGAPRDFIFRAADRLREITNLGLARAENLIEATQNADVFVEVSGILKTCATNLLKVSTDLRFLSSGPDAGIGELRLPARQAGSSIMPGKVNPVIPEAASQAAMVAMANDQAIAQAAAMGNLELNAFLPLIADKLLESIDLLARGCDTLRRHCVAGLEADEARCRRHVEGATATATALIETIGYEKAQAIVERSRKKGRTIREVAIESGALTQQEFDRLVSPENVTRLGSKREGRGKKENLEGRDKG